MISISSTLSRVWTSRLPFKVEIPWISGDLGQGWGKYAKFPRSPRWQLDYNKLFTHFFATVGFNSHPIVVYNIKIMTGDKLHSEIIARCSHKDNLRPNLPVTLAIPPVTQGQFPVLFPRCKLNTVCQNLKKRPCTLRILRFELWCILYTGKSRRNSRLLFQ